MNYLSLFTLLILLIFSSPLEAQKGNVQFRDLDVHNGLLFQPNTMKPFSGNAKEKHSNGKKRMDVPIKEGKIHGTVKEWARNGNKTSETQYETGVQVGKETQWYVNGQKKLEINYVAGMAEGVCTEWFKNGAKNLRAFLSVEKKMEPITGGTKPALKINWSNTKMAWPTEWSNIGIREVSSSWKANTKMGNNMALPANGIAADN